MCQQGPSGLSSNLTWLGIPRAGEHDRVADLKSVTDRQWLKSFPHLQFCEDGCSFEALVGVLVVDGGVMYLSILAAFNH